MAHTAGKWEARRADDPEYGHGYWLYSPDYGAVGYWRGGKSNDANRYWQLSQADAHLIAAAPDLLGALKALERRAVELYRAAAPAGNYGVNAVGSDGNENAFSDKDEAVLAARAAIAKAEGK